MNDWKMASKKTDTTEGSPRRPIALLVTVDVEEDMPRWVPESQITVNNIAGLPRLQQLCDQFQVRPTYLTTYPVAAISESARILATLQEQGHCEIGAHLHPWNTPPLPHGVETVATRVTELSPDSMVAKKKVLTETIERVFGARPRSYRAGRFGFNGACLQALEELGYAVDSSVTPGVSWRQEGGEDFSEAPSHPYFPDRMNPSRPGDSAVYEVPVSTGFTRCVPQWAERVYRRIPRWTRLRGLLSNDYLGWLDFHWLYPAVHSGDELVHLADVLIDNGAPMLNVFCHSSEMYPKASIYSQTEEDVDNYLRRVRRLFDHVMNHRRGRACTLVEFRASQLSAVANQDLCPEASQSGRRVPPSPVLSKGREN